ncbi:MAG: peptide ABC transporter substrate-binding protein [Planctomycetota bacterium]
MRGIPNGLIVLVVMGSVGFLAPVASAVEQTYVFNNGSEPETLDPHKMTGVPEHTLALAIYEGLTTHDPKTLEPRPGVAESWEVSEDRLTYTFHLRKNAKWSDGEGVTSADFIYSWERALKPETASEYAYQLYYVENAKAFNKGEIKDFSKVGVKAPDAYTLVVKLGGPTPFFLDLTSFETLMPVKKSCLEKHGDKWTRPGNLVGNGPYILATWQPRQEITFTPNPHYWNAGIVKLKLIKALPFDDLDTVYNMFLKEEVDWTRAIPLPKIDEIKRNPDYYAVPYLGTYYYRFNVTKPPFDNVLVRKAFSMAVDRVTLCRDVLKGGQIPATGYVPPGIHGYTPVSGPGYDRKKARELLAEAGYPDGKGFPKIELLYNTSESHKKVAEVIAQMWKENLGITLGLRNTEWKVYLDEQRSLRYQVSRAGWIGDYVDPNTFLDMYVTDGGNNNTGFSNAEYDRLVQEAAKEADPAKRMKILQRIEEILVVEQLPIMPIYFYVNQGLLAPKVKGFHQNIRDLHPFQFIYIGEEDEDEEE